MIPVSVVDLSVATESSFSMDNTYQCAAENVQEAWIYLLTYEQDNVANKVNI